MIEIVVATKNAGKIAEFEAALSGLFVKTLSLSDFSDVPEAIEDGLTFSENAEIKARHYAHFIGKACLADDSGLEVDALGGDPGVYSARYSGDQATDEDNNRKLLANLVKSGASNSMARFRCALAFVNADGTVITAEGACEGVILDKPRGKGGFGYDPLFFIPDLGKTMAELTVEEKNAISHRGKAIRNMALKLQGYIK